MPPREPTVAVLDRHIPCDGLFNLRDLGGHPTSDGMRLRWRTLFRSDDLLRAAGDDEALGSLGWRTALDLRTFAEREGGSYACDGVVVLHLPILPQTWDEAGLGCASDDPVQFLVARYVEMAEVGADAIAAAFEVLASPARLPAVFHCAAGKDRTGVLAALVLTALGVTDDVVADDYHLSSTAMQRMAMVSDQMARQPRAFHACEPEAILGLLGALRERHGSVEGYLRSIGVTDHLVESMRAALLVAS